jgi:hypothetical protein
MEFLLLKREYIQVGMHISYMHAVHTKNRNIDPASAQFKSASSLGRFLNRSWHFYLSLKKRKLEVNLPKSLLEDYPYLLRKVHTMYINCTKA